MCGSRKVTAVSEAARTGQLRPSGEFSEGKQAPGLRHLLHPAPGAELSAPPRSWGAEPRSAPAARCLGLLRVGV